MKRIIIGLIMVLSIVPAQANDVRSGNNEINPDTGAQVQADYQTVVTDVNGIVIFVGKGNPTNVPSGATVWSNNGSWGDVQVGGAIQNTNQGNLYAPPGSTLPPKPEPIKVVVPVYTPETSTVTVQEPKTTQQETVNNNNYNNTTVVTPVAQVPAPVLTDTTTVQIKTDTSTVVNETTNVVTETKTGTTIIDYSTTDWAIIDWNNVDWEAFWLWFDQWLQEILGVKP